MIDSISGFFTSIDPVWFMVAWVLGAGALGGALNALMTSGGFIRPSKSKNEDGNTIFYPGYWTNIGIGAVAALISWGLYGPMAAYFIVGSGAAQRSNEALSNSGLTMSGLVGAILVGVGGARWLSNEVDAAAGDADPDKARSIAASSSSVEIHQIAKE